MSPPAGRTGAGRSRPPQRKRRARPRSRAERFLLRYGWLLPLAAIFVGTGILALTYAFASIPLPRDIKLDSSAEVYDAKGKLVGTYADEERRFLIDTTKLPKYIGHAAIAAEDRDFFDHNGVSMRGIVRAAWANLVGGEIQQGGSTITQQYVKNAVLHDPSRTVTRKAKEAILAVKLERRYSKKQILGFYLNTIYLGRGAYGIEAAARTYFNKHATKLSLGEAAYLAGIIPAPESYQPDDNQAGARARRDHVLDMMVADGFIGERRAELAKRKKVRLAPGIAARGGRIKRQRAAYFMEWLRKEYLYPTYGSRLYTEGLKIHTTLDLDMQADAEEAVASILTEPKDPQAALVSMTPRGEVRAFVGGRDFTSVKKARGFNYASDYPGRQAGSAFKPFTLLTAIEEGISPLSRFSGASPVNVPEPCAGEDGLPPWEVENYGGTSYGTITLQEATTNSVNAVYAQLIQKVGPSKVVETLNKLQFDRDDERAKRKIDPDCGLALGILDVTPVEMARAYAGFAARGRLPEVLPITYIEDSHGNCLVEFRPNKRRCEEEHKPATKQVVEQNSADVLTQSLTDVVEAGTATVANIGRPVAGKTGTTQNNGNAWFAGYTPQLVTVVWEGYPFEPGPDKKIGTPDDLVPEMRYCYDPKLCRPVHGYEVTGGGTPVSPAVIWAAFMDDATAGMEILSFPEPVDIPDEVINSPAPEPTYYEEDDDDYYAPPASPEPTEEPEPEPTEEPEPEPTEEPEPEPSVVPSPTGRPQDHDEADEDP